MTPPFEALDFLYMPSSDPARDAAHFTRVLGARLVFTIEAFGSRVAMVQLTGGSPQLLFADHLDGEQPILVYRVKALDDATRTLEANGWVPTPTIGIPQGPCCSFQTPGGHRIAIYELTRPQVDERFAGRRDF